MLTLTVSDCLDSAAGLAFLDGDPVAARLHADDARAAVPLPVTELVMPSVADAVAVAAELPLLAQVDENALVVAIRTGAEARALAVAGAEYAVRWMLALPQAGARGHVAVAVTPIRQSIKRLRKDLLEAGWGPLIIPAGGWVRPVAPTTTGELVALGAIQDRPTVVRSIITADVLAGWLGHPQIASEYDPAPRPGVWRACDRVLDLVCRLYQRDSAIPLALTQDERVGRANAPWGPWWSVRRALELGVPVTVLPQPDVVAGDGDSWTAVAAFHAVAAAHGIEVLASWSGRPGHLTMAARVDPGSRAAFADLVHAEEARLCALHGLPTPARQVVRYREHTRSLTGGSAKRGVACGAALMIVLGADADGPVVAPIDPWDAELALGLGASPVIIRDDIALVRPVTPTRTARTGRARRATPPVPGADRARAGIPATAEAFIAAWSLSGRAALALTLPTDELGSDLSSWVWQVLWQLVNRAGATVDTAAQALEVAVGLMSSGSYKGKAAGSEGLRARLQWEWDRAVTKRAQEDARHRATGITTPANGGAVIDGAARHATRAAVEDALATTWAGLALDPRELLTWAVAAHWATRAATTTIGLDTRRWAIGLGVSQATISPRIDALLWSGAIRLTEREGQAADGTWCARRYRIDTTAGAPITRRASLATALDLIAKRVPHLPGMTAEALVVLATLIDAERDGQRTRVGDLTSAYGMTAARARRAVAVLEDLDLAVRYGHLIARTSTTLQSVLVAGRAASRWADREQARIDARGPATEAAPVELATTEAPVAVPLAA